MEITLIGFNELAVDLHRGSGQIGTQAAALIRKTAVSIERDGKLFCPVDTGNLRSSISTSYEGDGRFSTFTAEIGPTAEYAVYVEEGTSTQAPAAFMGPALDRNTPAYVAGFEKIAGSVL